LAAKAAAAQDAEKERIAAVRAALPPAEKVLGLDEFQVSSNPL
jgi:L-lactate dehydrogenase (cytochrome)